MKIAAVVLAAGMSRRMGADKLTLPWGEHTVIEQVLTTLEQAGVAQICLVSGATRASLEMLLAGRALQMAFNPNYADGEMIRSLQVGLAALPAEVDAALVVLGDQPQIEVAVLRAVLEAAANAPGRLVIPSYQMRRGHPWLLPHRLWPMVMGLKPPDTLRDFLNRCAEDVYYIDVKNDSVLQDLDTPEDYQRQKPN